MGLGPRTRRCHTRLQRGGFHRLEQKLVSQSGRAAPASSACPGVHLVFSKLGTAGDSGLLGPGSRGDLVPLGPRFLRSYWDALDLKLSSLALMGHDARWGGGGS